MTGASEAAPDCDFICRDCDAAVFNFGRDWCPVSRRCETCAWIADIEDPDEREQVRQLINGDPA